MSDDTYTLQVGMPQDEVTRDNGRLLSKEIDPSTILVQIIQRPQDPLTRRLQESVCSWTAAGFAVQPLQDPFGGWIDVSRNWQSKLFLKNERYEYCLLVDADVGATTETPLMLARHDKPVVSAVVCGWSTHYGGLFACFGRSHKNGGTMFPSLNKTKTLPARGLLEVETVGAGCVLVRRDVMEKLWKNYEDQSEVDQLSRAGIMELLKAEHDGTVVSLDKDKRDAVWSTLSKTEFSTDLSGPPFSIPQSVRDKGAETGQMPRGEDVLFSERVRNAGFTIHVDLEVHAYHEKPLRMQWPIDRIDDSLDAEDWQVSVYGTPKVEPISERTR